MDYDEACFMHLTPGVVHDFPSSPAVKEVYLAPEYICHFFLDSLSTDSSDFKSAGCRVGKFG